MVIGVATSKCLAEVEKWAKLSYYYLDCCHRAEDVPGTTFRFTGHLLGTLVKKLDNDYFTTEFQHVVEERGIRGVVTLGGITQGGVTFVVNMDEQARVDMVAAGNRLSLGPDGETGFVEQGGLDKAEKIDHEKLLLQAGMERLAEEQRAMQERYAALEKEATNREVEAVENQAAGLAVNDDGQQVGDAVLPAAQVLVGEVGVTAATPPTHAASGAAAGGGSPMQEGESGTNAV